MSCSVAPDCSGFPHHCPLSGPDADVAGIGVVWAFGVTSFITVTLSAPIVLLSLVEVVVVRSPKLRWMVQRLHLDTQQQRSGWVDNLVHIIIGLSDQQLVTGLAILIVGFSKHCSMSARHFWVVFDLGWFSTVTHLASLPVLNYYLHDYPRWRDVRVALMLSNFAFLVAAAVLTFGNYDPASHDCPIQCSFDRFQNGTFPVSKIHITQMVFVTMAFIWALVHLYAPDEIWRMRHSMIVDRGFGTDTSDLRLYIEKRKRHLSAISSHKSPKDIFDDAVHMRRTRFMFLRFFSRFHREHEDSTLYLILRWVLLMVLAPPSAIVWANLVSMWAMGAARLLDDRAWSVDAENEWGFGQVLPLLLLVLPFFTVTEVAQEFMKKRFEMVDVDNVTTTSDPDLYGNATLKVTQNPGESTPHVELSDVPLDHIVAAKLAHYPTEPNPSGVTVEPSAGLSRRSLTSASASKPRNDTATTSPPLISPPLFSPIGIAHSNHTGYNALPGDDVDVVSPVATTTAGPLENMNSQHNP